MAGFAGVKQLVDADDSASQYVSWRKVPTQATTVGIWFDLSSSPGTPAPQYYASTPLTALALARSTDPSLNHGGNVSPSFKFLRKLMAMTTTATALPMSMILCDYLLYYPFIDQGDTSNQSLVNNNVLTRYTDGAGVKIMAVVQGAQTGGQTFQVTYTNSAGVAGRTTPTVTMTSNQSTTGTILTSDRATAGCVGPFLPLQIGDNGVQSIQNVQCNGSDVGLFALVLVKPLAQMSIRGIDAPVEIDFFKDFSQAPRIYDDAYLNFLCNPAGTLVGTTLIGDLTVSWN